VRQIAINFKVIGHFGPKNSAFKIRHTRAAAIQHRAQRDIWQHEGNEQQEVIDRVLVLSILYLAQFFSS